MFAFYDADVVDKLIEVLNRELRRISIWPNVQAIAEIKESDVWKLIQSRVLEVTRRYVLVKAVETHAELIRYVGREGVVFACVNQRKRDRVRRKESSQLRGIVQQVLLVVDKASANLVFVRHVVIHALDKICPALPGRRNDRNLTDLHITGGADSIRWGFEGIGT